MRLFEAEMTVSNPDSFITAVGDMVNGTGTTVQAFDARYVMDREHLEQAVKLADRAIARNNEITRDRAVEILFYTSGRRQVNRAFEIDVSEGTSPVVVLVDGGDEAVAEAALFNRFDFEPAETLGDCDESLVHDVFDVGKTELHVIGGDPPALIRERVALLAVDR